MGGGKGPLWVPRALLGACVCRGSGGQARAGSCSSPRGVVTCGVVLVGTAECRRGCPTDWAPGAMSSCLGVEMPAEARGVRGMHPWVWKYQWGCQM